MASSLPSAWQVDLEVGAQIEGRTADALLTVCAPAGECARLIVESKQRLEPAMLPAVLSPWRELTTDPIVIVAPFIGSRLRQMLAAQGVGWADATGNLRIVLDSPAVFVERRGADVNPWPEKRGLQSLRGPGSAAAVRALCDFRPPYGLVELATRAGVPVSTLFRVVQVLLSEGLIEKRGARGPIEQVDWRGVMERWAHEYSLNSSNAVSACLEPRGLDALEAKLRSSALDYALTSSRAAREKAPIASTRLVSLYTREPRQLAEELGLVEVEAGMNVRLVEPFSPVLMERGWQAGGLRFAALPQVATDLLTGPGREPAEAEALLDWMAASEEAWRV